LSIIPRNYQFNSDVENFSKKNYGFGGGGGVNPPVCPPVSMVLISVAFWSVTGSVVHDVVANDDNTKNEYRNNFFMIIKT
jgi:hypothetical protein